MITAHDGGECHNRNVGPLEFKYTQSVVPSQSLIDYSFNYSFNYSFIYSMRIKSKDKSVANQQS